MREEERKEQEWREEEKNNKDYHPPSPVYDPIFKQDPLPHCSPKEKQALDPNYYPPNYVPEEEDAPILVDNLVALPVNPIKEEDQGKEEKGE